MLLIFFAPNGLLSLFSRNARVAAALLTMEPILRATGVSKRFGSVTAADGLHVAAAAGEVIGIVGANGAGKTVFVNMITGV